MLEKYLESHSKGIYAESYLFIMGNSVEIYIRYNKITKKCIIYKGTSSTISLPNSHINRKFTSKQLEIFVTKIVYLLKKEEGK